WPDTWNGRLTARALSFGRQAVGAHQEAEALDQRLVAGRATRVLPGADLAGPVAGVNEAQALLGSDLGGADELAPLPFRRVGHAVVGVEAGHVPGNIFADRRQEAGGVAQLRLAIVEARDDERDDLQPEAALVEHADAFGDVVQGAAQGAVVTVVEALQI